MIKQSVEEHKQAYFAYALSHLVIDEDRSGTLASVPSERVSQDLYRVDIDESGPFPVAVSCECGDHTYRNRDCKHMQVVNAFYTQIASFFVKEEPTVTPDEIAALAEERNEEKLPRKLPEYRIAEEQAARRAAQVMMCDPCGLGW